MKTTHLEMGLLKLQAETPAESQAICGIIEMTSKWMPAAVANNHGCRNVGKEYFNWCVIPDGHLDGQCHQKHPPGAGCGCLRDGIEAGLKQWGKLPWDYVFKPKTLKLADKADRTPASRALPHLSKPKISRREKI